jgi:hypothetical protein
MASFTSSQTEWGQLVVQYNGATNNMVSKCIHCGQVSSQSISVNTNPFQFVAPTHAVGCKLYVAPPAGFNYSTLFPGSENPVSESNLWLNGKTDGRDWADCQTIGGRIIGTNYNPNASGGPYDDAVGLISGTYGADQEMIATVYTESQQTASGHNQEIEFRLRSTVSSGLCTGYEVAWRCSHTGEQYFGIARWNGTIGDFASLGPTLQAADGIPGLVTGTQIRAKIVGTVITAYQRPDSGSAWQLVLTYDTKDDIIKFSSGLMGVGFWNRQCGLASNQNFGISALTAQTG